MSSSRAKGLICLEEEYLFIYNLSYRRDEIKRGTEKILRLTYGKDLNYISAKFGDCTSKFLYNTFLNLKHESSKYGDKH